MRAAPPHRVPAHRPRALAIIAVAATVAAAGFAAALLAGGDAGAKRASRLSDGAKVTTTSLGTVIARQVDGRRGLVFEVSSSPELRSGLTVRLAADAPRATRDAVLTRPLVGTCDVPGERVGEFAGHWDRQFAQYGTALMTDPELVVAKLATTCGLWVGDVGDTADVALFGKRPLSRVRLR